MDILFKNAKVYIEKEGAFANWGISEGGFANVTAPEDGVVNGDFGCITGNKWF